MLNLFSLLIGLVSLVLTAIAFVPPLGAFNWFIVPMAIVGAGLGALSRRNGGRNLNIVVIAAGVLRLILGGGIL